MSAKHTPGPWVLGWLMVEDPAGGPRIANCNAIGERPTDELNANARLIAAAPDLLDACRDLMGLAERGGWMHVAINKARAAIVKAEAP